MKQIIKINRNDIKQLVKESIYKVLLNEAKSVDSLIQSFVNKNPNINAEDLRELFLADPTSVRNNNGEFVGKYATWIGNLYVQNKLRLTDITDLRPALNIYNINKSQLPAIKTFNSLSELIDVIKDYSDNFKAGKDISLGERECELVYEDDTWKVYTPHTYRASRWIGGDTHWCTASSDERYFKNYTEQGPLYVNVNKQDGKKYQFHFGAKEFTNEENIPIVPDKIDGFTSGLRNFYLSINPDYHYRLMGLRVEMKFSNGATVCESTDWEMSGRVFISSEGEKTYFDYISDFADMWDCYSIESESDGFNLLHKDGYLLFDNFLYDEPDIKGDYGLFTFQYNNVYLLWRSNDTGELKYVFDHPVESCDLWRDYAIMRTPNNKDVLVILVDGKGICSEEFDYIDKTMSGQFIVHKNGMANIMNKKFEILSNTWYSKITSYADLPSEYLVERKDGKTTIVNETGEPIYSDLWFDNFTGRYGELYFFKIDGKQILWNCLNDVLMNSEGEFVDPETLVKSNNNV